MAQVWIGHGRIFTHDIHTVQFILMHGVHDFDNGQPDLVIQAGSPQFFESLNGIGVVDFLVIGIHHRYQAHVRGALDIVLPAQRMQARSRPSDLPCEQGQGYQAAGIVRAVYVLGDAHAPEDDGIVRVGIQPCHLPDPLCLDAANGRDLLGGVLGHRLFQVVETGCVLLDEFPVMQVLGDDGLHYRVQQQHIRCRRELQEMRGMADQVGPVGLDDNQLAAALDGIFHEGGGHRMVGIGPRTDNYDHVRLGAVGHLVGDGTGADGLQEGGHR